MGCRIAGSKTAAGAIPNADHVFTNWDHRKRVTAESVRWLKKQLT